MNSFMGVAGSAVALCFAFACNTVFGVELIDSMRGVVPIDQEVKAQELLNEENKDVLHARDFSTQPPTIPHKIDGYQLDKNVNRCIFCHNRTRTNESNAPPISATHNMNRDGTVLEDLSPRRYFCTQCHVPQHDLEPRVNNNYENLDSVRKRDSKPATQAGREKKP